MRLFLLIAMAVLSAIYPTYAQTSTTSISDSLYLFQVRDSIIYYAYRDTEKSLQLAESAIAFAKSTGNERWEAMCLQNQAAVLGITSGEKNLRKAIAGLTASQKIYQRLGDSSRVFFCYHNIEAAYHSLDMMPDALNYATKAVKMAHYLSQPGQPFKHLGDAYGGLANVYMKMGLHDSSIVSYQHALELLEANGSPKWYTYKHYIGRAYVKKGALEQGMLHLKVAYDHYKQMDNLTLFASVAFSMGDAYLDFGATSKSTEYYREALWHAQQAKTPHLMINAHTQIAKAHHQANQMDSAFFHLRHASHLTDSLGFLALKIKILELEATFLEEKGNYLAALALTRELRLLSDSLKQRENLTKAMILLVDEQKKAMNAEIDDYQNTINTQNNLLYFGVLGVTLLIAFFIWAIKVNKKNKLRFQASQQALQYVTNKNEGQASYTQRKLASTQAHVALQHELLEKTNALLSQIQANTNLNGLSSAVKETREAINNQLVLDKAWEDFFMHFEEVHPHFAQQLNAQFKLTPNDIKLCAFIKIGLANKEICQLLNISTTSIHVVIHRLKKKLNLPKETSVYEFLQNGLSGSGNEMLNEY